MEEIKSRGMDRRGFLRMAGIAGIAMVGMACTPAAAPPTAAPTKVPPLTTTPPTSTPVAKAPATSPTPSDAEWAAKLYEAARKEGEVMVYAMGTQEEWAEIAAAFEKKFPGVKVQGYTATSEQVRDKVLNEARARKVVGELLWRNTVEDQDAYAQEGVLESYLSPQLKYFEEKYYDPKGTWYIDQRYVHFPEYNTKAIPKDQAPTSYADLLKPEFKGKLGLEANAFSWFSGMLRVMGKEKGVEYMKKLAEQKPRLISGHYNLQKLVSSGEIPIATYLHYSIVKQEKDKGSPIEWVMPKEVVPAMANTAALLKNAPHPNASKLMIDFLLSEEAAKIVAKQLRIPTRKGVALGELEAIAKVPSQVMNDPAWGKEVMDNQKVFRDIFGKP